MKFSQVNTECPLMKSLILIIFALQQIGEGAKTNLDITKIQSNKSEVTKKAATPTTTKITLKFLGNPPQPYKKSFKVLVPKLCLKNQTKCLWLLKPKKNYVTNLNATKNGHRTNGSRKPKFYNVDPNHPLKKVEDVNSVLLKNDNLNKTSNFWTFKNYNKRVRPTKSDIQLVKSKPRMKKKKKKTKNRNSNVNSFSNVRNGAVIGTKKPGTISNTVHSAVIDNKNHKIVDERAKTILSVTTTQSNYNKVTEKSFNYSTTSIAFNHSGTPVKKFSDDFVPAETIINPPETLRPSNTGKPPKGNEKDDVLHLNYNQEVSDSYKPKDGLKEGSSNGSRKKINYATVPNELLKKKGVNLVRLKNKKVKKPQKFQTFGKGNNSLVSLNKLEPQPLESADVFNRTGTIGSDDVLPSNGSEVIGIGKSDENSIRFIPVAKEKKTSELSPPSPSYSTDHYEKVVKSFPRESTTELPLLKISTDLPESQSQPPGFEIDPSEKLKAYEPLLFHQSSLSKYEKLNSSELLRKPSNCTKQNKKIVSENSKVVSPGTENAQTSSPLPSFYSFPNRNVRDNNKSDESLKRRLLKVDKKKFEIPELTDPSPACPSNSEVIGTVNPAVNSVSVLPATKEDQNSSHPNKMSSNSRRRTSQTYKSTYLKNTSTVPKSVSLQDKLNQTLSIFLRPVEYPIYEHSNQPKPQSAPCSFTLRPILPVSPPTKLSFGDGCRNKAEYFSNNNPFEMRYSKFSFKPKVRVNSRFNSGHYDSMANSLFKSRS